ncbi:MAG: hypothetical protein ABIK89_10120 [Planctomycetota bacterium]
MSGWVGAPLLALVSLSLSVLAAEPPSPSSAVSPQAGRRQAVVSTPAKVLRYCRRLVEKYDRNADGRLQQEEWVEMLLEKHDQDGNRRLDPDEWDPARVKRYDRNRDGALEKEEWQRAWKALAVSGSEEGIAVEELAQQIARHALRNPIVMKPPSSLGGRANSPLLLNPAIGSGASGKADGSKSVSEQGVAGGAAQAAARGPTKFFVPKSQFPRGLPAWFLLRDADGDGQLTMPEFAPKATQSQIDDFASYDHNGDGVITAKEGARGPKLTGKQGAEEAAEEEMTEEAAEDAMEEPVEEAVEEAAETAAKADSRRLEKARRKNRAKQPSKV